MKKRDREDREVVIWNEVMKARRKSNKLQQTRAEHKDEQPPCKVVRATPDTIANTYDKNGRWTQ
jgi:hypothetical protein